MTTRPIAVTCPLLEDSTTQFIDWSENHGSTPHMELCCQQGQGKTASFAPVALLRLRNKDVDGDGEPGTKNEFVMMETHGFVNSTVMNKDPNVTAFIITNNHADLVERGHIGIKHQILQTDNCCAQFKSGTSVQALGVMGERLKQDVRQVYRTSGHGKSPSDAAGAVAKVDWRKEEMKPDSSIRPEVAPAEYADELVNHGNRRVAARSIALAAGCPSMRNRRRVSRSRFVVIPDNVPTGNAVDAVKYRKYLPSADSFGVMRKFRDIFCFMYVYETKKYYFRNLPCGCPGCKARKYEECENKEYVSKPMECKWVDGAGRDVDSGDDEDDEDDESILADRQSREEENRISVQERTDSDVEKVEENDFVAVLVEGDPKYKFYIMKVSGPVITLDKDVVQELVDDEGAVEEVVFERGSKVLHGQWYQWSKGDKARGRVKKTERVYEPTRGEHGVGYVYSHLVVQAELDVREWSALEERQKQMTSGTGTVSILVTEHNHIVKMCKQLSAELN